MKNYFYLSLSMHVLLFCSFLILQFHTKPFSTVHAAILSSYLFSAPKTETSKVLFKKSVQGVFKNKNTEKNFLHHSRNQRKQESQQDQKTFNNALLTLLHEAIFEKQSYPEEAVLMHETGRVTISMKIHPNGDVDHITLLKSSGYPLIDTAAQKAVADISPLDTVKKYLASERVFVVDVNFE